MTKSDIQNPKQIVTNDYQQFWAHFEWFLLLFQISDGYFSSSSKKYALCTFWYQNKFLKKFNFKSPPLRCPFQRPLLIGLICIICICFFCEFESP